MTASRRRSARPRTLSLLALLLSGSLLAMHGFSSQHMAMMPWSTAGVPRAKMSDSDGHAHTEMRMGSAQSAVTGAPARLTRAKATTDESATSHGECLAAPRDRAALLTAPAAVTTAPPVTDVNRRAAGHRPAPTRPPPPPDLSQLCISRT